MLTLDKPRALPEKMYLCCGLSFRLRSRLNLSPVSNKLLQSNADVLVLCVSNSLSTPLANNNGFFIQHASHGSYKLL